MNQFYHTLKTCTSGSGRLREYAFVSHFSTTLYENLYGVQLKCPMIASVASPSAILSHGQANLFMNAVYSWWS